MSDNGKKFAEQGGAKVVSIGIGSNSGFNREAYIEALFNGGPEDKILSPLKEYADAEKSPSKLFMNMIDKGLDIGAQKEIAAGKNEDVKTDSAKVVQLDKAPVAKEVLMRQSAKSRSA